MIYVLVGPVGSGKTLMATQRLVDYAAQGRRIAANYHVDLAPACNNRRSKVARGSCTVVSPLVSVPELEMLGIGGPTEDRAGLLVWDEAGDSLNSRTWDDKYREAKLRWLRLSRKRKWDVLLMVQVLSSLDKQLRDGLVEIVGRVRRTDRIKLFGVKMPRAHIANMRYGTNSQEATIERWISRGNDVFACYDTHDMFNEIDGPYSVLPPAQSKWRHVPLSRAEQLMDVVRPFSESSYLTDRRAREDKRKPRHPLVDLISRLPAEQAIKHWKRLEGLGVFSLKPQMAGFHGIAYG